MTSTPLARLRTWNSVPTARTVPRSVCTRNGRLGCGATVNCACPRSSTTSRRRRLAHGQRRVGVQQGAGAVVQRQGTALADRGGVVLLGLRRVPGARADEIGNASGRAGVCQVV